MIYQFPIPISRFANFEKLATEEEGFEPPVRVFARTADFESAPFVHSGTPPVISYPNIPLSFSLAELA